MYAALKDITFYILTTLGVIQVLRLLIPEIMKLVKDIKKLIREIKEPLISSKESQNPLNQQIKQKDSQQDQSQSHLCLPKSPNKDKIVKRKRRTKKKEGKLRSRIDKRKIKT